MIVLKNLNKTFKLAKRNAGLSEAVKALFRKDYSYIQALKDVSFTIKDGEMVGYIGPNGAGKSSTIKIMSGILTPGSGKCSINVRTPWRERIAHVREIGVVFGQHSQLWWDVPAADASSGIISNGEFDRIMVRPRNEILQVLASRIEFSRIGRRSAKSLASLI